MIQYCNPDCDLKKWLFGSNKSSTNAISRWKIWPPVVKATLTLQDQTHSKCMILCPWCNSLSSKQAHRTRSCVLRIFVNTHKQLASNFLNWSKLTTNNRQHLDIKSCYPHTFLILDPWKDASDVRVCVANDHIWPKYYSTSLLNVVSITPVHSCAH